MAALYLIHQHYTRYGTRAAVHVLLVGTEHRDTLIEFKQLHQPLVRCQLRDAAEAACIICKDSKFFVSGGISPSS